MGKISIWPRLSFWVGDGLCVGFAANRQSGMVFHHNVKDAKQLWAKYYHKNGTCSVRQSAFVTKGVLVERTLRWAKRYKEFYPENKNCSESDKSQCPYRCL